MNIVIPKPERPHQLVKAFASVDLDLNPTLVSMLNEKNEHRTPRRGCGFTQATRFLADIINRPRRLVGAGDTCLFADAPRQALARQIALQVRESGEIPRTLSDLRPTNASRDSSTELIERLQLLHTQLTRELMREESQLIGTIMRSILFGGEDYPPAPALPSHDEKLPIGTCPEAERFFMQLAAGDVRRGGIMNVISVDGETPLLVEKIGLGDPHSCILLSAARINSVWLPPGSLIGTWYSTLPVNTPRCAKLNGTWLRESHCDGFRFLRLTTLSVSPKNRVRAFTTHVERQLDASGFYDPLNTLLDDLVETARAQKPATLLATA